MFLYSTMFITSYDKKATIQKIFYKNKFFFFVKSFLLTRFSTRTIMLLLWCFFIKINFQLNFLFKHD